ncbi:MAG: YIP1 family protein [Candidatus Bathyarchaeia archaeon]
MFAYGIFKVIYAPHKAFKEIIQNPRYIGPILIMILFIGANAASTYTLLTKTYVEETLPTSKDEWTENSALWRTLNGALATENFTDHINGNIYGNRSIEFSIKNSTKISMQLDDIGSINCSSPDGYTKIYLRIKWTSPNVSPKNISLYLYSTTSSNYFYYNLTEKFSNLTANIWNNLTVPFTDEKWLRSGTADWSNITGLKLELAWLEKSNITVLMDGLFFGGIFKSPAENLAAYITNFSVLGFMQFVLRWVLLGGIIFIMTKVFKANTFWRVTLILIGFALITMFIQALINTAAFSTLPTLKYPFEYIGGVKGESETAYNKIIEEAWFVNQIYSYVQAAIILWTIALCGIAIRFSTEFSWAKSLLIATVAYFAATTAESFLIGI